MVDIGPFQLLSHYERNKHVCHAVIKLQNSNCPDHSNRHYYHCNINALQKGLQFYDVLIHGLYRNYCVHNVPNVCCRRNVSNQFNPLSKRHLIDYKLNDKISVYTDHNDEEVLFQSLGNTLCAFEITLHLSNITVNDPSQGPGHWLDILLHCHRTNFLTETASNSLLIYTEDELNYYIKSHILGLHQLNMLFFDVWKTEWEPFRQKTTTIIYKMGGRVFSLDWTQKVFNKLFDYQKAPIEDEYKPPKTVYNNNVDEKKKYDPMQNWLKQMLNFDIDDKRRQIRKMKVANLTILNQLGYCMKSTITPNNSEAHIYMVPELAEVLAFTLHYSTSPIKRILIKSDGFENAINVRYKIIKYLITLLRTNFFIGLFFAYNLLHLVKYILLAVDGLHRVARLTKSGALLRKDRENRIIFLDRMFLSLQCERKPKYINLCEYVDVISYLKSKRQIYFNQSNLQKLINYTKATFGLRRTLRLENRLFFKRMLNRGSTDYIFASNEIKNALYSIVPEHLQYYLAVIMGLVDVHHQITHKLHEMFALSVDRGNIVKSKILSPHYASPTSCVYFLAKTLQIAYLEGTYLISKGFHTFNHFYGHLVGFYEYGVHIFLLLTHQYNSIFFCICT